MGYVHEFRDTSDAVVISALRGLVNRSQPSGKQASILHQRCQEIFLREDVDARSFRTSVEELLAQARRHDDMSGDDPFITYLAVLAD